MITLFVIAFVKVGGYEELVTQYFNATAAIRATTEKDGAELCGAVPGDAMHLLRSATPGNTKRINNVISYSYRRI